MPSASSVSAAPPAATTAVTTVDLAGPSIAFDRYFQRGVGSCHAYLTLREDFREHVRLAQREIGFGGIRFHGIFSDYVSVVQGGEDPDGGPRLNFQNVTKIYEFFVAQGMKPFVELGFMPARLASGTQTIFDYRANVTPPKDPAQWARLVRRFVAHLVERFGIQEVITWHFEVWNEPDLIGAFWTGDQADYFRLYAEAARAVKSVDQRLRVGGPATSKTAWVPALLDYCAANKLPLDFISTHHYAVDADLVVGQPDGPMYYRGPAGLARDVARVRAEIAASAYPRAELHFTEWNVSPAHEDVFGKDTAFTATLALQAVKDISGLADSYMWWTVSDIFEESGITPRPFSGKYGLVNLHGVKKPVFHAFRWLAGMHDTELPLDHASARATRCPRGGLRLLAWNLPEVAETALGGEDWKTTGAPRTDTFALSGIRAGRYRLRIHTVDDERGNALAAWRGMGSPDYPHGETLAALHAASEAVLLRDETLDLEGDFSLALTLASAATVHVELAPV
jgi:xylan 1,4-beta-xylosidase